METAILENLGALLDIAPHQIFEGNFGETSATLGSSKIPLLHTRISLEIASSGVDRVSLNINQNNQTSFSPVKR